MQIINMTIAQLMKMNFDQALDSRIGVGKFSTVYK
jgi:hypothetical protein